MPVLPLVASRMVREWLSLPERSPSRTILDAARSLTEPPGLKYSALAKISTPGNSAAILSRRSSGVLPMVESRALPGYGKVWDGKNVGHAHLPLDSSEAQRCKHRIRLTPKGLSLL